MRKTSFKNASRMPASASIPSVFCWTKMGAEAGQSLEAIVWRKEMERLAGNGTFCWGIGNALGDAPALARKAASSSAIEVLFTPMKSQARSIDRAPTSIVVWLTFTRAGGSTAKLPDHMLVTSRAAYPSGETKRHHYALLCVAREPIRADGSEVIDAARTRNLGSSNPVGPSQVTALVTYTRGKSSIPENPYRVAFRARLVDEGVVRLGTPVELRGELLEMFRTLWDANTFTAWLKRVVDLKRTAWREAEGDLQGAMDLFNQHFKPWAA